MSQEKTEQVPFRSIRVTLSEEAITRLEYIMKTAAFRSASSAVEECIRATYDIMREIYSTVGRRDDPLTTPSIDQMANAFERIGMRMSRFTGRTLAPRKVNQKE